MRDVQRRVLELSWKYKLSHLSSNLSSVGIIDDIFLFKNLEDNFVLSCGHAGLANYVNLEKHENNDAEALYLKHKTHPSRDVESGIHVSSGSLGSAITIALGMAMADHTKNIYCLISDGESYEGSIYETLNIKSKYRIHNLKIFVNMNGFSGLEAIETSRFRRILESLDSEIKIIDTSYIYTQFPFLDDVRGHYQNLTEKDWEWINNHA